MFIDFARREKEKHRNTVNVVQQVQQLDPVSMYVNGTRPFQVNQGHARNNGGKGGNSKKERPICTYCGFTGHIVDKWYFMDIPQGISQKVGLRLWLIKSQEVLVFDGHSNA